MKKTYRIAPEIKEQILKRIKDEGLPVVQVANEHGVSEAAVYRWIGSSIKNIPTIGELIRLRRQNAELLALVGELTFKSSQSQKKN